MEFTGKNLNILRYSWLYLAILEASEILSLQHLAMHGNGACRWQDWKGELGPDVPLAFLNFAPTANFFPSNLESSHIEI